MKNNWGKSLGSLIGNQAKRIIELKTAIEKHYNESTGHNQCWINDEELWSVLNDGKDRKYNHNLVPSEEEFDRECKKYYKSRVSDA